MDNQYDFTSLSNSFQMLIENKELTFQVFDMFPIPMEIFAPDGLSVYINRAMMDFAGISDASLVVGKYNLVTDPVCNDQMGYRELIQRAFRGEQMASSDFKPPIQDLVDRGVIEDKPFELALTDFYLYPVWNGDQLAFVVNLFIVKSLYRGKPDVAKAKEYIDKNWRAEFDPQAVASAVNMSVRQLYNLFNQHAGMAPGDYYKQTKVNRIKEKVSNKNLTIAEAFAACGEDSRGTYARVFKEIVGLSPKEYRASIEKGAAENKNASLGFETE